MYSAMDVARYCVSKCANDKKPISNLKLQKIMFYIQMDSILIDSKKIFTDEIQAWMHGPVVPDVYYHYSVFGASPIVFAENSNISDQDKTIFDKVIDKYRDMDVWDLVAKTHVPGGSWDRTYLDGAGAYHEIKEELMKECRC